MAADTPIGTGVGAGDDTAMGAAGKRAGAGVSDGGVGLATAGETAVGIIAVGTAVGASGDTAVGAAGEVAGANEGTVTVSGVGAATGGETAVAAGVDTAVVVAGAVARAGLDARLAGCPITRA